MFLHGLEQRRLRLRRGPVDLVSQDDVREDGAGSKHHLATAGGRILLHQIRGGDVRGHQVGRELDTRELQLEHLCHGVDEQRLGEARHTDDEAVTADEECQQNLRHHIVLSDNNLLEFRDDAFAAVLHPVGERQVVRRRKVDSISNQRIHEAPSMGDGVHRVVHAELVRFV